jgi:hypothetical protein
VKDEFEWLYGTEHYEPAVGLYDPASADVASRFKNPPASGSMHTLLGGEERTWELLTRAEVEKRLGYPVAELPRDNKRGEIDLAKVELWVCIPATIQYTVWSDVYRCEGFVTIEEPTGKVSTRGKNAGKPIVRKKRVLRGCRASISLWDVAVEHESAKVAEDFACPCCGQMWKKVQLKRTGTVPVLTNYIYIGLRERRSGQNREIGLATIQTERPTPASEIERIRQIDEQPIQWSFPTDRINTKGPQYNRNALSARGVTSLSDFYSRRNLRALARLWHECMQRVEEVRRLLIFALTSTFGHIERMTRYKFKKGGNSSLTGQLYFPSFPVEDNVLRQLGSKVIQISRAGEVLWSGKLDRTSEAFVLCGHAAALLGVPDRSIDYVFADPPFGSNIYYSEVNWLYECWLGKHTKQSKEAVVHRKNDRGTKTLHDYSQLMAEAFCELFRVLKPGRWATIEFNNNDGRIFESIKQAIRSAGFEIVNMLLLDKTQKTFKQVKGAEGEEDVVDKDVLFNLHKPAAVSTQVRAEDHDLEQQVADAVCLHLQTLPERIKAEPAKYSDEHRTTATINSMLMNALIPRGVSVERLNLPFIERVCTRYFRKFGQYWYLRGEAVGGNGGGLVQEEVEIKNELTAIAWLRQKLESRPALIGELKPLWMRATGLLPARVSQSLILENILTENFWRDADTNRWREPTAEERERMNDDRSLRVLHDAERFVNNTLDLPTTDDQRCQWIDVLFQACRAIEDNESDALPALHGFDKTEAYSLIPRLFQSILRDHVSKEAYIRAEKQARAASQRVAKQAEQEQQAKAKGRPDSNQTILDFGG